MVYKDWSGIEDMPYCFPRSSVKFQITRPIAAIKSIRFALFLFFFFLVWRENYLRTPETRYVNGTPTSEVTPSPVTIRYIRPPHHGTLVNIMVMNGWLPSFSFHVNRPSHSWDKAISDSDLEISTPRSRSWMWSKGKVIQSAQYHINSLCFHFKSIRLKIPAIKLFQNLTLKHLRSRSWVRSKVKVTYCTHYPTDALPFRFTSIGPTIQEIWSK